MRRAPSGKPVCRVKPSPALDEYNIGCVSDAADTACQRAPTAVIVTEIDGDPSPPYLSPKVFETKGEVGVPGMYHFAVFAKRTGRPEPAVSPSPHPLPTVSILAGMSSFPVEKTGGLPRLVLRQQAEDDSNYRFTK
jgi:hypothetical protein